jgi:uncharacterized damage-inducible protein DinB
MEDIRVPVVQLGYSAASTIRDVSTAKFLLDLHDRCHRSLAQYLEHCRSLTSDALDRELDGFGYPTVRMQLHHAIGAERYWVTVLQACMDASEDEADAVSITALEAFRHRVFDATHLYLREASEDELTTQRPVLTWGGHEKMLAPIHVILRTQTHIFHHCGQVAAMCRLLGYPIPAGMDFPIA